MTKEIPKIYCDPEDPRSVAGFESAIQAGVAAPWEEVVLEKTDPARLSPHVQNADVRLANQIPPEGIKWSK